MQLTAEEQACTRQVAAQIGRNPANLIREGEQVKASGWRSAQQQAEGQAQRSAAGGGLGTAPGLYQDPCAGPSVMAAHRDHHAGSPQRMGRGARLMTGTGSGREPNWDDLVAPIARTRRGAARASARRRSRILAGRSGASPGQARIQPLSGSPAATPSLRRGRDAHPQTPAGERPKARLNQPYRHALGPSK